MFTAPSAIPRSWSIRDGMPNPTAETPSVRQRAHRLDELGEQRVLRGRQVGRSTVSCDAPVGVDHAREDLGPAEVDSDDAVRAHICRVT